MTRMDCAAFGDAAAELALGILTGPDRSAALDHIDRCASCQAEAASLAAAADPLLDLIPARGAPAGFESRTAAAIRQSGRRQTARRCRAGTARTKLAVWRWRVLAATAVAAAGPLGIGLHEIATTPAKPAYLGAALAVLRTPAGARAGEAFVTGAPRPWLVMIVNAGLHLTGTTVTCASPVGSRNSQVRSGSIRAAAPGWSGCPWRTAI